MIMRSKDAPGISAYKSARRNATNGTDLAIPSRVKASTSDPLVAVIVICATARLPRVMRSVDADGQGARSCEQFPSPRYPKNAIIQARVTF
jgi:hypothetical protein